MPRYRNGLGATINVPDEKVSRLGPDWVLLGASTSGSTPAPAAVDYGSMKVAELRAEIHARNIDRTYSAEMSTAGLKAELIAALAADDQV